MDITSISRTIVVLNVVGSNPTSHPKKKDFPSGNPFLMPLYRTPRYKRKDRCSLAKTSVCYESEKSDEGSSKNILDT